MTTVAYPDPSATCTLWPTIPAAQVTRLRNTNWAHSRYAAQRAELLAASSAADRQWRLIYAAWAWHFHQAGHPERGDQPLTPADLADAYTQGRRDAHPDQPGWDDGWDACYRRFGAELGTRSRPRRAERATGGVDWTRHHPDCHPPQRRCAQSGCLPGGQTDFGKPCPWDYPGTPA